MYLITKVLVSVYFSVYFARLASAQSSAAGNDSCGDDITARRQYYTIEFTSYCQTEISSAGNSSQIQRDTFLACSTACVDLGKRCGGFAFDRDSHFSENNCHLLSPTDRWDIGSPSENVYYDSASIVNSSLPLTRSDCLTTGENRVYSGYNLLCGQHITGGINGTSVSTVFASSISDCIEHCKNQTLPGGTPLCQAVTWDPTVLYGYDNCRMIGQGYAIPTYDPMWDSATLIGTMGTFIPNTTSGSSPANTTSNEPTAKPSEGLSIPGIGGIALCSAIALAIVIAGMIWYWKRREKKAAAEAADEAARSEKNVTEFIQGGKSASVAMMSGALANSDGVVRIQEIAQASRGPIYEADASHALSEANGDQRYRWT